jgi:hypothetical protein
MLVCGSIYFVLKSLYLFLARGFQYLRFREQHEIRRNQSKMIPPTAERIAIGVFERYSSG